MYNLARPAVTVCSVRTNNPTAADVLADTGALDGGVYDVRFTGSADANAVLRLEHRNAANSGNSSETPLIFDVGVSAPAELIWRVNVLPLERVRIAMNANLTGNVSAAIQAFRIA